MEEKLWLTGNVSHLCVSLLATVAPTCFRTASLDDTPGEQMCSNESIPNSDVREAFGFFLLFCSVCTHQKQSDVQGSGTNHFFGREIKKHKYSLPWKLKLLFFWWGGAPCFFFNDTFILIIIRVQFLIVFIPQECVIMFRLTFQLIESFLVLFSS